MNKLLPFAPANLWRAVPSGVVRKQVHVDPAKLLFGTPIEAYHNGVAAENVTEGGFANCISSRVDMQGYLHMPILDVDRPCTPELQAEFQAIFDAPVHWVPSTNFWHVYIDVPPYERGYRVMSWVNFTMVLAVLANEELIDKGWSYYSRREEQCVLRKPGLKKVLNKPTWSTDWSCMWCSKGFTSEQELEEHEATCE